MSATAPPDGRERMRLVQRLFEEAVELSPEARLEFLAEACPGDPAVRAEVQGLLEALARGKTGELLPPLFAPTPADLVGRRVHNYEVVAPIAEGGMGAVYLARHRFIERRAALKVLHAELSRHGDMVQRFLNEARAANAIRHPNIIEVVDAGILEDTGRPYILMEHLEGQSLGARLRQGPLSVGEAVRIAIETADALAAAHDQKIVHRDLKPENLFLVERSGRAPAVKVLDFGIAKLRADIAGTAAQTHAGTLLGTPQYMSPEQCRDVSAVDHRTDIYAIGLILYEMVCGRPPFQSKGGFGDLLYQQLTVAPVAPRTHNREIPAALEAVILRCLAKSPEDRFASMREVTGALRASVDGATAPTLAAAVEEGAGGVEAVSVESLSVEGASVEAVSVEGASRTRPRTWGKIAIVSGLVIAAAAAGLALSSRSTPEAPASVGPPAPPVASAPAAVPAAVPPPVSPPRSPPAAAATTAPAAESRPAPPANKAKAGRAQPRPDIPDFLQKNPYR